MKQFKSYVAGLVSACMLVMSMVAPAQAGFVGTEQAVKMNSDRAVVASFMDRQEVQDKLVSWGVDAELVDARLAALSDTEMQTLAQQIEKETAGAGAVGIIGAVFLVLLILELVGVIDVFKSI